MSRIGKLPVPLPDKVKAEVKKTSLTVEGPKGKLTNEFNRGVKLRLEENTILVEPEGNSHLARAMYGTARAIIANMVLGVTEGFTRNLEVSGVGFRAAINGNTLDLNLGYSHPIRYTVPEDVTVTVVENTKLTIAGIDKQKVGAVCADIRRFYPPEPYKGKGVRFAGERIRRKEGKTVS